MQSNSDNRAMNSASSIVRKACLLALLTASAALSAPAIPPRPVGASANSSGADSESFDIGADSSYANYRQAVVDYLVSRHSRSDAHVCVLGERDRNGNRTATVWWREGARIIEWEGGNSELAESVSNLDLHKDVVASEKDLHGSTYLVTRRWVTNFETRCAREGTSFVIHSIELDARPPRR